MSMNAADLSLDQIGPSAETINQAISEGYIDQSFTQETEAGNAAFNAFYDFRNQLLADSTPTQPVLDKWGRAPGDPFYGIAPPGDGGGGGGTPVVGNDATNTLKTVLAQYGLEELSDVLYSNYTRGLINLSNPDAIMYSIKNENAYKKRFAANEERLRKGLPELDPASYVELEKYYRDTMRLNGLPANFYDQEEDFKNLIAGDVSPAELQTRINDGFNAVAQADPAVRQNFARMYGVGDAELAAYFLDPEKAAPLLKERARAAQIAGRAEEQAGIRLMAGQAEELARRGVTSEEAQTGFAEISKLGELRQTFAGEQDISVGEQIGAKFGYDPEAEKKLEQRRRQRVGEFVGGGSFATTQGQTSGVGKGQ